MKEESTFSHGVFVRFVWKVKGLTKDEKFYIAVASQNLATGKEGNVTTYPNYSGSGVGAFIIKKNKVVYGPAGQFEILYTESFKKEL